MAEVNEQDPQNASMTGLMATLEKKKTKFSLSALKMGRARKGFRAPAKAIDEDVFAKQAAKVAFTKAQEFTVAPQAIEVEVEKSEPAQFMFQKLNVNRVQACASVSAVTGSGNFADFVRGPQKDSLALDDIDVPVGDFSAFMKISHKPFNKFPQATMIEAACYQCLSAPIVGLSQMNQQTVLRHIQTCSAALANAFDSKERVVRLLPNADDVATQRLDLWLQNIRSNVPLALFDGNSEKLDKWIGQQMDVIEEVREGLEAVEEEELPIISIDTATCGCWSMFWKGITCSGSGPAPDEAEARQELPPPVVGDLPEPCSPEAYYCFLLLLRILMQEANDETSCWAEFADDPSAYSTLEKAMGLAFNPEGSLGAGMGRHTLVALPCQGLLQEFAFMFGIPSTFVRVALFCSVVQHLEGAYGDTQQEVDKALPNYLEMVLKCLDSVEKSIQDDTFSVIELRSVLLAAETIQRAAKDTVRRYDTVFPENKPEGALGASLRLWRRSFDLIAVVEAELGHDTPAGVVGSMFIEVLDGVVQQNAEEWYTRAKRSVLKADVLGAGVCVICGSGSEFGPVQDGTQRKCESCCREYCGACKHVWMKKQVAHEWVCKPRCMALYLQKQDARNMRTPATPKGALGVDVLSNLISTCLTGLKAAGVFSEAFQTVLREEMGGGAISDWLILRRASVIGAHVVKQARLWMTAPLKKGELLPTGIIQMGMCLHQLVQKIPDSGQILALPALMAGVAEAKRREGEELSADWVNKALLSLIPRWIEEMNTIIEEKYLQNAVIQDPCVPASDVVTYTPCVRELVALIHSHFGIFQGLPGAQYDAKCVARFLQRIGCHPLLSCAQRQRQIALAMLRPKDQGRSVLRSVFLMKKPKQGVETVNVTQKLCAHVNNICGLQQMLGEILRLTEDLPGVHIPGFDMPNPDSKELWVYKVELIVKRGTGFPRMDSGGFGKADPYAVVRLAHSHRDAFHAVRCTTTAPCTLNPEWNSKQLFVAIEDESFFQIDVFDEDAGGVDKDDFIGTYELLLLPYLLEAEQRRLKGGSATAAMSPSHVAILDAKETDGEEEEEEVEEEEDVPFENLQVVLTDGGRMRGQIQLALRVTQVPLGHPTESQLHSLLTETVDALAQSMGDYIAPLLSAALSVKNPISSAGIPVPRVDVVAELEGLQVEKLHLQSWKMLKRMFKGMSDPLASHVDQQLRFVFVYLVEQLETLMEHLDPLLFKHVISSLWRLLSLQIMFLLCPPLAGPPAKSKKKALMRLFGGRSSYTFLDNEQWVFAGLALVRFGLFFKMDGESMGISSRVARKLCEPLPACFSFLWSSSDRLTATLGTLAALKQVKDSSIFIDDEGEAPRLEMPHSLAFRHIHAVLLQRVLTTKEASAKDGLMLATKQGWVSKRILKYAKL